MAFELELTKIISVLGPFAKAIECLEHSHCTAADVFLYWLAIQSQLQYLFEENRVGLPASAIEDIRAIANRRFDEMINESPNDVYLTAFYLDPRKSF